MRFQDAKILAPTVKQQARVNEHWDKVRADLHRAESHEFERNAESTIAAEKFQAMKLVEQAARHAQRAIELAEWEVTQ